MARIAGIDLPKDKRIEIGLTSIYGIGRTSATKILEKTGIDPDTRVRDLTEAQEAALHEVIGHEYIVEGDLRRNVALDIKRLIEIGSYRGQRHKKSLPVRGQRSKTNARTRKGPKKTIANKEARSLAAACKQSGISRSAYYKYKDYVFLYDEQHNQRIVTLYAVLKDRPGVLANVLSAIHSSDANVMTLNQSVPVDGVAPITMTLKLNSGNYNEDDLKSSVQCVQIYSRGRQRAV